MKNYKVEITETLQKVVEVEAESEEQAEKLVQDAYYDCEEELTERDLKETTFNVIGKEQPKTKDFEQLYYESIEQGKVLAKALEIACYNHIMQVFNKDKINISKKLEAYIVFYIEKAEEFCGSSKND